MARTISSASFRWKRRFFVYEAGELYCILLILAVLLSHSLQREPDRYNLDRESILCTYYTHSLQKIAGACACWIILRT